MISPVFLATLNVNIAVKFKDFETMKQNPVAQHAMVSASELLRKMTSTNLKELSDLKPVS